jgi:hypothetical protein
MPRDGRVEVHVAGGGAAFCGVPVPAMRCATQFSADPAYLGRGMQHQCLTACPLSHPGLLSLVDGIPSDVGGTWRVEIDLRDAERPALTHRKTQGKPHQQLSLDFAVRLQLGPRGGSGGGGGGCSDGGGDGGGHQLRLEKAELSIPQFSPHSDPAVLSPAGVAELHAWHAATSLRLRAGGDAVGGAVGGGGGGGDGGGDAEVQRWRANLAELFEGLHPLRSSTPHDIFRCVSIRPRRPDRAHPRSTAINSYPTPPHTLPHRPMHFASASPSPACVRPAQ